MKKTVKDIDVKGKKVIVRCDFNVPQKDGSITDDTRITAALPTIKYLLSEGAAVILMSHLGRPEGEANMKYTLKPVADRLEELCSIKSREELIADIVALLQAPARNVISALQNAGGNTIAGLVKTLSEKEEK